MSSKNGLGIKKIFAAIKIDCLIFGQEETGAEIAQLGERQTEDLKVAGSIPAFGTFFFSSYTKMYGWHVFDYFLNLVNFEI